ncbi:uncharacterized protein F4817DRAFT_321693 [Daldinia loculata]|uniref:uncharacterized protein n=1 Tax=Daldinia loculata TaxID=103429 RepID=UPI0020C2A892|nr:uncharacterized protein F4817DRAFT_321693 [Daldinia loculata]KAI1641583.1 hypothetical protein F4817DRAFT_321693 [Daldinia loculata]
MKELSPQQRKNASKLRANALPAVPAPEPAVPPRRSRRLQEAKSEVSTDPAAVAFTDSGNGASLLRPGKITLGNLKSSSSAKPRAIAASLVQFLLEL